MRKEITMAILVVALPFMVQYKILVFVAVLLTKNNSGDAMKKLIREEGIVTKSSETVNPSRNSPLCQSKAHIITEVVAVLGD